MAALMSVSGQGCTVRKFSLRLRIKIILCEEKYTLAHVWMSCAGRHHEVGKLVLLLTYTSNHLLLVKLFHGSCSSKCILSISIQLIQLNQTTMVSLSFFSCFPSDLLRLSSHKGPHVKDKQSRRHIITKGQDKNVNSVVFKVGGRQRVQRESPANWREDKIKCK